MDACLCSTTRWCQFPEQSVNCVRWVLSSSKSECWGPETVLTFIVGLGAQRRCPLKHLVYSGLASDRLSDMDCTVFGIIRQTRFPRLAPKWMLLESVVGGGSITGALVEESVSCMSSGFPRAA